MTTTGPDLDRWPLGLPTRIRPIGMLSRGPNSAVWSARDGAAGVDLVVKVVLPHGGWQVDPAVRIETEARALARLGDLDGVVVMREAGRTDAGVAWLAYDRVDGVSLHEMAPLGWSRLREVGSRVARTLAGAHARHVCHGDVSASNVLVDTSGGCWLADFGVAGLGLAHADPGGITPAFAAPERLHGAAPSAASDVWSLARTLCVVGVGEAPDPLLAVLERALEDSPPRRPTALELAELLERPTG